MKLYSIVFSPTGGTQKVAALLTKALGGEAAAIDLTDSKQDFSTIGLTQEDVALIAVPSYGGRVPAAAVERLTAMHGQGARAVLVCVYGNRAYEDTLVELEDAAQKAGFRVVAAWRRWRNTLSPGSLPRAVPMPRTQHSLPLLAKKSGRNFLRTICRNRTFRATVPTKKPEVPVWCLRPPRRATAAVFVRRNVRFRPSRRMTPPKWMKRHVSPACAVFPYARRGPEKSIRCCCRRRA